MKKVYKIKLEEEPAEAEFVVLADSVIDAITQYYETDKMHRIASIELTKAFGIEGTPKREEPDATESLSRLQSLLSDSQNAPYAYPIIVALLTRDKVKVYEMLDEQGTKMSFEAFEYVLENANEKNEKIMEIFTQYIQTVADIKDINMISDFIENTKN